MTLFLKDEDVAQCVTMDAMLEAIESMQRQYGNGQAHNMTRRKIIAENGMLSVMGGGLFHQGLLGVKTYTVVKGRTRSRSAYTTPKPESYCVTPRPTGWGSCAPELQRAWQSSTWPTPEM